MAEYFGRRYFLIHRHSGRAFCARSRNRANAPRFLPFSRMGGRGGAERRMRWAAQNKAPASKPRLILRPAPHPLQASSQRPLPLAGARWGIERGPIQHRASLRAAKSRAPKIYPTGLAPLLPFSPPHTGDFEELRNLGMCGYGRDDCFRGVKPKGPAWRTRCIQHRRKGHGAKPRVCTNRRRAAKQRGLVQLLGPKPGKTIGQNGAREARGVERRRSAQTKRDHSARIARPASACLRRRSFKPASAAARIARAWRNRPCAPAAIPRYCSKAQAAPHCAQSASPRAAQQENAARSHWRLLPGTRALWRRRLRSSPCFGTASPRR